MKRIQTTQFTQAGASLLELCVAISLSAVVLTGATVSMRRVVQWYNLLRNRYESEQAILETYAILERGFSHIETSRRRHTWKIHRGGNITLADGSAHPINRIQGTSAPRQNSDAFSVLEFAPHNVGAIRSMTASSTSFCNYIDNQPRSEKVLSIFTIGIHGSEQLAIESTSQGVTWPSACGELATYPLKSIFIKSLPSRTAHQSVLPIVQEYTLLVDKSSHLRLISHRGTWIRENQPLVDGIREITITSKTVSPDTLVFSTTVKAVGGVSRKWDRPIILARREAIDDTLF